jgi:hypothetical protein
MRTFIRKKNPITSCSLILTQSSSSSIADFFSSCSAQVCRVPCFSPLPYPYADSRWNFCVSLKYLIGKISALSKPSPTFFSLISFQPSLSLPPSAHGTLSPAQNFYAVPAPIHGYLPGPLVCVLPARFLSRAARRRSFPASRAPAQFPGAAPGFSLSSRAPARPFFSVLHMAS